MWNLVSHARRRNCGRNSEVMQSSAARGTNGQDGRRIGNGVFLSLFFVNLILASCCTHVETAPYRDRPYTLVVDEVSRAASAEDAEERIGLLLNALHRYLENEESMTLADRASLSSRIRGGFYGDDSGRHDWDLDIVITVEQLACIFVVFIEESMEQELQGVLDGPGCFIYPDLAAYALLWAGCEESIDAIHKRMDSELLWRSFVMDAMLYRTLVDRANPRLLKMKKRITDSDRLEKLEAILKAHREFQHEWEAKTPWSLKDVWWAPESCFGSTKRRRH